MKMLRWGLGVGGAEILCMCSGALKNRWAQGEGVKTGYRTKGLIAWAGMARFAEIPALYDNRASLVSWDPSTVTPGSRVEIFQVITLAGRPGEWTKRDAGQRVTRCSCPLLPRLMWSGPYCELYCHTLCAWKLWNLPLSWFVHERIRPNLINPRVLKIERDLYVKMLDSAPFTWRNATCWRDYLLKEILRNHFLSENMQWNYASFNVTLNYFMHEIMEFCVTSSLARDNWEQKCWQTLGNKPNHSHCVLRGRLFFKGKIKNI